MMTPAAKMKTRTTSTCTTTEVRAVPRAATAHCTVVGLLHADLLLPIPSHPIPSTNQMTTSGTAGTTRPIARTRLPTIGSTGSPQPRGFSSQVYPVTSTRTSLVWFGLVLYTGMGAKVWCFFARVSSMEQPIRVDPGSDPAPRTDCVQPSRGLMNGPAYPADHPSPGPGREPDFFTSFKFSQTSAGTLRGLRDWQTLMGSLTGRHRYVQYGGRLRPL
jgi:hypothetical protein